jgi:ceramide glucosyltransferase
MAATLVARLYMTRPPARATAFPPLSVIKPLHGDHPGLAEDLEGFCLQDYPGEIQILFGVHTADDPAAAVVRALKARRPDMDIELVVDRSLYGTNRKVSNLINIAARARNDVLVLSDADIGIAPDYLRRVVGALQSPGVGAVTCLYVGKAGTTLWARLGAMGINYHFLPNAMLGKSLKLAQPCFGSTIALTRAVLFGIGATPWPFRRWWSPTPAWSPAPRNSSATNCAGAGRSVRSIRSATRVASSPILCHWP